MTVVIAALPHRIREVAEAVRQLGGTVQVRDDDLDYLRVRVPLGRAEAVIALPGVQAADVSVVLAPWRPAASWLPPYSAVAPAPHRADAPEGIDATRRDSQMRPDTTLWPPQLSRYPFEHPYSPLADLDATVWRAEHPAWDGRGVTIADLEWTPDMLAPELQTGLTVEGRPVPKYVDIFTTVDPDDATDSSSTLWLRMRDTLVARGGTLIYRGRTYTTPHDGAFRANVVNERSFVRGSIFVVDEDLNRDGNPSSADSLFTMIWDEHSNTVWVDTDQDGDFARERPMTDFAVRHDVGVFGQDDPRTPLREAVGFTVQIDRSRNAVALNVGLWGHGTMVQGAAVGYRGTEGHYDGIAPGARLVSINYGGGSAAGLSEALIRAFKDPRIDIVVLEQNVFLADMPYRLRDGRFVPSVISSRLVDQYRKLLLVPGGNRVGVGVVGEHAAARGAIGVGAYESSESYRTNLGALMAHRDNLHFIGSGGPAGDGALKPDVLAPSDVLSSWVGFKRGYAVPGLYELPPGYVIAAGTSTATGVAAGVAALLISAARQTGVRYDAARLRQALLSTARPLDGIPVFEQGNGLIRVAAAWDALVRMGRESSITAPVAIEVRAPVSTAVSERLGSPHEGPGLYEIDGWVVGQRSERTIILTRTSGLDAPLTLTARWIGNDGTFGSARQVILPRGVPVLFPVTIAPQIAGVHSALLELAASTGTLVHRIPCVVVVPNTFAAPTYSFTLRDSVPRPGRSYLFLRIPSGAGALVLNFSSVTGAVAVRLHRPDGREIEYSDLATTDGLRYLVNPEAGVWQLSLRGNWETFHADQQPGLPLAPVRFTLRATLIGARLAAPPRATAGQTLAVTARNTFGPVTAAVATTPLASGYARRGRLGPRAQSVYMVHVPPGSPLLLARVTPRGPPRGDLDLYLFDCTKQRCVRAAASADTGAAATLAYPNPAPGAWKLLVDAAHLAPDTVAYDYLDLVLNPTYGTTGVADPMSERSHGAEWSAAASVWQASPIVVPRQPYVVFAVEHPNLRGADSSSVAAAERAPLAWTAVPLER